MLIADMLSASFICSSSFIVDASLILSDVCMCVRSMCLSGVCMCVLVSVCVLAFRLFGVLYVL